jgi:hypothetical protein
MTTSTQPRFGGVCTFNEHPEKIMRRRSITFIERKLRAESRNTDCLVGMSIVACELNRSTQHSILLILEEDVADEIPNEDLLQ